MAADPIFHTNFNVESLDSEIWSRFKSGDKKALSHIYTRHFDKLYNYGSRITKDLGLVEDSIQDLFVEFWNRRAKMSDVKNIRFYLYKSLRRKIIYNLSLVNKEKLSNDLTHFDIQLSDKSHYLSQEITKDTRLKLSQLISNLLPKQKEAIFLIYYEELSYEDAAVIMGLKVKTVYNLIHLAISKLREQKSNLSSFGLFSFL